MNNPDYSVRLAEPMSDDELRQWFADTRADLAARGAVEFRFAVDDVEEPTMALVEGWLKRPDWNAVPPPQFPNKATHP
jgi:hypothetical protein